MSWTGRRPTNTFVKLLDYKQTSDKVQLLTENKRIQTKKDLQRIEKTGWPGLVHE